MSGKKSDLTTLALRYAVALMEKAEEDGILDTVSSDIASLAVAIEEVEGFRELINNPLVDRRKHLQVISAVSEKADFHKISANFLGVLASNRRLSELEDIIMAFNDELSRRRGEIKAEVESAQELNDTQIKALNKELANVLGAEVSLSVKVSKELIGGLRVIVGSKMIDNSVSHKLERLRRMFEGNTDKQIEEVA